MGVRWLRVGQHSVCRLDSSNSAAGLTTAQAQLLPHSWLLMRHLEKWPGVARLSSRCRKRWRVCVCVTLMLFLWQEFKVLCPLPKRRRCVSSLLFALLIFNIIKTRNVCTNPQKRFLPHMGQSESEESKWWWVSGSRGWWVVATTGALIMRMLISSDEQRTKNDDERRLTLAHTQRRPLSRCLRLLKLGKLTEAQTQTQADTHNPFGGPCKYPTPAPTPSTKATPLFGGKWLHWKCCLLFYLGLLCCLFCFLFALRPILYFYTIKYTL